MRRWALLAPLAFALLLIPVPGASAATCTVSASGSWTASGTWSCHSVPGDSDAVVIPAGKTVSLPDGDGESAASVTIKGGTLALGDSSELDAADFAAVGGGTISGPQYALLEVDLDDGVQATIDAGGLTVNGAYVNMAGNGTSAWPARSRSRTAVGSRATSTRHGAAALPGTRRRSRQRGRRAADLGLRDGRRATHDLLRDGGTARAGRRRRHDRARRRRDALQAGCDDHDARRHRAARHAEVHVVAGRLIGRFSGAGELSISPGATLGLSGTGAQFTPPAIDIKGGTIEVEPGADASLALPAMPALHHIGVLAGASLDVSVDTGTGPVEAEAAPDDLAQEIAIGGGATLSIDGGGGILALAEGETLGGGGMLDGSLVNTAGTVAPNGKLNVTGNYSQAADGTLALDLRSASDGDSLTVDGMVDLAGTLRVATAYAPGPRAAPLVLAATSKPEGAFAKTFAPISAERGWVPGVWRHRRLARARRAERRGRRACVADGARSATRRARRGRAHDLLPGDVEGRAHAGLSMARGTRPIAGATRARYRVAPADRGHRLSCRVTATSAEGARATASSRRARVHLGLGIAGVSAGAGGALSANVWCARSERRCSGSLSLLVAGHAVALGHFTLRSPGGIVRMTAVGAQRDRPKARPRRCGRCTATARMRRVTWFGALS